MQSLSPTPTPQHYTPKFFPSVTLALSLWSPQPLCTRRQLEKCLSIAMGTDQGLTSVASEGQGGGCGWVVWLDHRPLGWLAVVLGRDGACRHFLKVEIHCI